MQYDSRLWWLVGGHQQLLLQSVVTMHHQEVQSLLDLLYFCTGVRCPAELLRDVLPKGA